MTRALRRFIARLGIAALLFMQLAVAVYACPGVLSSSDSSAVMAMADTAEAMPASDCAMIDPSAPNLCEQHCQHDSQANGQASPSLVFAVDLPLLTVLPLVEMFPAPLALGVSPEFLAHATAPPPSIRFGVFRS
jgi:hypothetical protein